MILIVIALILFALIGAPLFAIFGAASMALFLSLPEGTLASVAIDVFSAKFAESPSLMTIPLFTFAGYLLAESGTPTRLVNLARTWLGWMPGGVATVCLLTSAFFTTFTGGSGITIVAVGGLLFPALLKERYPEKFSLGLITTAGSLGLLFPPSLPLIMYGIIAGLVIDKVLVAGLIPGFITVGVLVAYAAYIGVKTKVPRTPFHFGPALKSFWIAKWEILIPFVLIGGFLSGLMRLHEASAFTAVYVLVTQVFVYRDISIRKDLPRIVRDSMALVGAIMVILGTSIGFNAWLIQAQVPLKLVEYMESMVASPMVFLLILNVFLLVVGMLMDIFTAIFVVVPLLLPLAYAYGVDPYHMAIIFILNLEIGYLTPPVGMNLFISSIRFNKPVTYLYRSVLVFIVALGVALGIVTYVPSLSTWLPSLLNIQGEEQPAGMFGDPSGSGDDLPMMPDEADDDFMNELWGDDEEDAGVPEQAEADLDEAADTGSAKADDADKTVVGQR